METDLVQILEKIVVLVPLIAGRVRLLLLIPGSRRLLRRKLVNQRTHFLHPIVESHSGPEFGVVHIRVIGYSKIQLAPQPFHTPMVARFTMEVGVGLVEDLLGVRMIQSMVLSSTPPVIADNVVTNPWIHTLEDLKYMNSRREHSLRRPPTVLSRMIHTRLVKAIGSAILG